MSILKTDRPLPTADEALRRLIEGNLRFLRGEARSPTVQKEILANLAQGQPPFMPRSWAVAIRGFPRN